MTSDRFVRSNGYQLSPDRQLLLQAALLDKNAALTAWEQWQSSVDIEVLDSDSYLLLPQLYQNLLAHGVEAAPMARLKGIYRRNWYANQLQLKRLYHLLANLQEMGIEAMMLGDAALFQVVGSYRQISNFQLLVRAHDLERAIRHLSDLNWQSYGDRSSTFIHLQDDCQHSLYLQGRLFWAIPQEYTDELVWQHATQSQDDLAGWQPSATDLFLVMCARMFDRNQSLQIGDLADAMMLMRSGTALDWLRLIAQAQRYQMILPVRNTIVLLERLFQAAPPNWVLPALWQMPISRLEWLNYQGLAGDRQAWRSAKLARTSQQFDRFAARVRQLKYLPFPGRQTLKNLLKPTTSAIE